ncbi:MAG: hypothetical protein R3B60_01390 [Candidatus Paceibacterota bacterium]
MTIARALAAVRISKNILVFNTITESKISFFEPKDLPSDGEMVLGNLNRKLIEMYVSIKLEYKRIKKELYSMSKYEERDGVEMLSLEIRGLMLEELRFINMVRDCFEESFIEDGKRPFQIRKGWKVVFSKEDQ